MDRLRARLLRDGDDRVAIEIALARRRRTDPEGFVAGLDVQRLRVGIRVDGHGADA